MIFKTLTKKGIASPRLFLKLEIELIDSIYTEQEATDRIQYLINNSSCKEFSNLIVFLLRETKSSMWELRNLEITE